MCSEKCPATSPPSAAASSFPEEERRDVDGLEMVTDTYGKLVVSHSAQNQANRCGSSDGSRCRSSCSVGASDSSHAYAYLGGARMPVVVRTAVEEHDGAPSRSVLYVHGRHSKSTQVLHASHAAEDGQWDLATP